MKNTMSLYITKSKEKTNITRLIFTPRKSMLKLSFLLFSIICLVQIPAYANNSFFFPKGKMVPAAIQAQHSEYIPDGSMLPTFKQYQMIYYIPEIIKDGDIIIYNTNGHISVGRVIGVPEDTVKISGNELYVNNKVVPQKYIGKFIYRPTGKGARGLAIPTKEYSQVLGGVDFKVIEFDTPEASMDFGPTVVKANTYYILGDNRDNSKDSRFNGLVSINNIIGVVHPVVFSPNDLWSLYHMNEVMFVKNLTGKYIYIYGSISNIKIYHHKHAEVVFNGNDTTIGEGVDCIMGDENDVYGLESGQRILVGGRISKMHGLHLNDVGLYNCTLETGGLQK